MAARLCQIAYVLIAAALAYVVCVRWCPPLPLAIATGGIALVAIVLILIGPTSWESWEDFWASLSGWMGWW